MPTYDTGHTTTIAFATSSFTAPMILIGSSEMTRPSLDKSHLGTTNYRSFKPGDLVDAGEFDIEFFYDPDEQPPITGAAETVTIDLDGAGANGATIAGTAFFTSFSTPELVTDQIMRGRGRIKWDGGPTFTDET